LFAYLKGKFEEVIDNYIVIDVNGVGYKVYTSLNSIQMLPKKHEEVFVRTYLYVKEDILDLYGFISYEEMSIFKMLISVSGVGPKAALSILSSVKCSEFALAIATQDFNTITKAQGVGPKLAQRIILELKDKIKSEDITSDDSDGISYDKENNNLREAINALIVLGYTSKEASDAVKKVSNEDLTVEEIIKLCLKSLIK
jgi:Holliday junction DNA helicase RuvA